MEELIKTVSDYVSVLVVERWAEFLGLAFMVALWRWWMGHKLRDRIAALEARLSGPYINQTFIYNAGTDADDEERQLRAAIEATSQNLKETIKRLPQMPLGDGHTYASLPNGTNIVTLDDGTIRLALPVRLSTAFHGGLAGSLSATVTKVPAPDRDIPCDG